MICSHGMYVATSKVILLTCSLLALSLIAGCLPEFSPRPAKASGTWCGRATQAYLLNQTGTEYRVSEVRIISGPNLKSPDISVSGPAGWIRGQIVILVDNSGVAKDLSGIRCGALVRLTGTCEQGFPKASNGDLLGAGHVSMHILRVEKLKVIQVVRCGKME